MDTGVQRREGTSQASSASVMLVTWPHNGEWEHKETEASGPALEGLGASGLGFPAPHHHCSRLGRGGEVEQVVFRVLYCPLTPRVEVGAVPKRVERGGGILIEDDPEGPEAAEAPTFWKGRFSAEFKGQGKGTPHPRPGHPALSPELDPEHQTPLAESLG